MLLCIWDMRELVDNHVDLADAPGRANAGDKVMTLVASALAGGDCIDDADVLRAGGTAGALGCVVKVPSTPRFREGRLWGRSCAASGGAMSASWIGSAGSAGTGLGGWGGTGRRAITIDLDSTICETYGLVKEGARHPRLHRPAGLSPAAGHCRRYRRRADVSAARGPRQHRSGRPHFLRETVSRVHYGGASGQLTMRADSGFYTHAVVSACRETNVRYSITVRQHARLRNIIEDIPEADWTPIPYWMDGAADVAETDYTPFQSEPDATPVRLIVRRVKPTPGSQLALFANYSYHAFITDREGDTLELEADHRRHAEIENAIRDPASSAGQALKYGVGLNHLPSGRFSANATWLAVQSLPRTRYGVIAHNLARWTARISLGEPVVTTKTLRRRFFSIAGRITHSARRLTLHLPRRWPWKTQFSRALARLRAIPLPA